MNKTLRRIYILCLCLTLCAACAAAEPVYTVTSVTDCAQTDTMYDRFYQSGELSVIIPGLAEGFVPQGIAYLPEEGWLLFGGYRTDKGNSALIAVDRQSGEITKEVLLLQTDGSAYNGHAGGVCVTDSDIYVSNQKQLFRISLAAFRALPESGTCAFEQAIPVPVNASYCAYADGILWVGEFEYGGEYATDTSHKVSTADGIQRAWTCGYRMDGEQDFTAPDYILSMTERIQGITTRGNTVYLSQSYGRRVNSVIYRYDDVLARDPDQTAEVNGQEVPLWILDSSVRSDLLLAPPMSECLCTIEDAVYVLFESGAETYMNPKKPSRNPMDRVFILTDY